MKTTIIVVIVSVILIPVVILISQILPAKSDGQLYTPIQQPEVEQEREYETKTVHVSIVGYAYSPSQIIINKGDRVVWTNQDSVRHDVNGDGIESPLLSKGETFSYTFSEAGTYNYICTPHPYMKGTIIVVE
jgi:amicyanin